MKIVEIEANLSFERTDLIDYLVQMKSINTFIKLKSSLIFLYYKLRVLGCARWELLRKVEPDNF